MLKEIKKQLLTKQIKKFYQGARFIPAPIVIDLHNPNCTKRIINDMLLLGANKNLISQLNNLD